MMDWFRWFAGTASDPVFLVIARRSGQPTANVVALWAMLLERANTSVPRGEITGFDFETADFFLEMPEGAAESIVRALRDKGYIEGERISRQAACRAFCEEERAIARNRETTDPPRRKTETTSVPADMNVTQCHVPSRKVTLEEKRKEKKRGKDIFLCGASKLRTGKDLRRPAGSTVGSLSTGRDSDFSRLAQRNAYSGNRNR